MKPLKGLENRLRGWLPKEPYLSRSQKASTGWALPKVRFSTAVKFRVAARLVIAAISFPLLAFAIFSNFPLNTRIISIYSITLTDFVLVFIADAIAKKRYTQKTPAEVEKF
jgi:hypothetical protein